MKKFLALAATIATTSSFALPLDMHGEFQADTYRLQDCRRLESTVDNSGNLGSQEPSLADGNQASAGFQTYIFKLQPEIIVNDSTTLKAELTSGYGHGGNYGESSTKKENVGTSSNFTSALYTQNTVSSSALNLTQAFATFYADTATYKVGRHATHWGLGAIHNSGDATSSRHATIRDVITIDLKIGNFKISPYYSKISAANLTRAGRIKESGVALLYNNIDKDLSFGILYATNKASSYSGLTSDVDNNTAGTTGAVTMGLTDVNITDLYFKKSIGMWTGEIEVPLLSGELGSVYTANTNVKYKAKAILVNNTFTYDASHSFNFNVGQVSGDDGIESSFDALFLNPNYQVANLLFRFNLAAIGDPNQNIYDSYVTNTTYLKASHRYFNGKWSWTNSVIWAKAAETAVAGTQSYNHTNNKTFTADYNQSDDLGIEIDSSYKYNWNTAVTFGVDFGYLLTGDYFAYNNTATPNATKNTYMLSAFANIKF